MAGKNILEAIKLLDECEKGNHRFEVISRVSSGPSAMLSNVNVIRWCSICGAIVVDQEVDGKLFGRIALIKGSTVIKFLIQKIRQGLEEFKEELKNIKERELSLGGLTDEENIPRSFRREKINREIVEIVKRAPILWGITKALGLSDEEIREINKEI